MADIFNSYMQGAEFGQRQRAARDRRNQLAEIQTLAPKVMGGDLDATTRAYALDPTAAQTYQQEGNRQQQQLLGLAKSLKQAGDNPQLQAGIYRSAVPFLKRNFGAEVPDVFDAAAVMPIVEQVLAVGTNSPGMGGSGVQSTYVDNNGQRVAIMRDGSTQVLGANDAGANQQTLTIDVNGTPTQVTFDRRSGRYTNATLGGQGGQQPQPAAQGGYQQINGQQTYIDPSLPPQVQQQIRQSLAAGQEPPAQMAFAGDGGQAGTPLVGRRAEEQAAAVEAAKQSVQQQFLPQELGMRTDAAIRQSAGIEQAKSQQERASNERAKSAQLNNVDRGLARIDAALNGLSGRFVDTGPIDGRIMSSTPQGQELEAAVGAIQNDMLALTRVPGIGSQSDLEAKIANLKYPSIYNAPEVNARNAAQLKAFLGDLRRQIQSSPAQQQPASAAGAPRQIQSAEEYNALPSGALFIAPDGTQRRKR